ncbi:Hypothetical predicted protein, partial [Pelobates cultripes]
MFNVAGINLQIIYLGNDLKPIKRRLFLKQLSHKLTLDELQRRSEKTIGIPLHIQSKLKLFRNCENVEEDKEETLETPSKRR